MKKIINVCKYWGQVVLLPIYWLSFLVPRNKNIWLFGSTFGRRFADNPRYLYLYVSQHSDKSSDKLKSEMEQFKKDNLDWNEDNNCKNIRAMWISHDKKIVSFLQENGYEAYYYHSLKGIWYALRGKVYIFDNYSKDINFWQSGGAVKVNLWHGIPLKKIQADNKFDKIRNPETIWRKIHGFPRRISDEKPSHYVLTTSDFMVPIFSSAFRTKNVLTSGYPRNDRLIKKNCICNLLSNIERETKNKIETNLKGEEQKKMVYYMPTFRESETKFFDVVDLKRFQEFLEENNILFCTKLHPKSKLKKEFSKISSKNIIVIDADTDPYVFLEMADVLVTDYSSIYFDFLVTNKPIIFFDYDLEEYLKNSREMYFDYEKFTPGQKVNNYEKFEEVLFNICNINDELQKEYQVKKEKILKKVFNETTVIASQNLVRDIKKNI